MFLLAIVLAVCRQLSALCLSWAFWSMLWFKLPFSRLVQVVCTDLLSFWSSSDREGCHTKVRRRRDISHGRWSICSFPHCTRSSWSISALWRARLTIAFYRNGGSYFHVCYQDWYVGMVVAKCYLTTLHTNSHLITMYIPLHKSLTFSSCLLAFHVSISCCIPGKLVVDSTKLC